MLLSVIIPCYNGSRTVAATLDNLVRELNATCSYEIIVVNDGSTDNSADILANFAMKYPSIRIFAKDNGGVSSARNYGLRHASGDYIWFFDADDLCFDGAVEKLISLLNQYRPDICNFWSLTVDARMKNNVDQYNNSNEFKVLFNGFLREYIVNKNIPFACWSSIVRRTLLTDNEISFRSDLTISEDVAWNLEIACKCPEADYIATDLRVVKYILNPNGAVNSLDSKVAKKQLLSYIAFAEYLQSFSSEIPSYLTTSVEKQNSEIAKKLVTRLLSSRTGIAESTRIKQKIKSLKNINGGRYFHLLKYPFLIPLLQLLYRNIFLRLIKPRISRN